MVLALLTVEHGLGSVEVSRLGFHTITLPMTLLHVLNDIRNENRGRSITSDMAEEKSFVIGPGMVLKASTLLSLDTLHSLPSEAQCALDTLRHASYPQSQLHLEDVALRFPSQQSQHQLGHHGLRGLSSLYLGRRR